MSEQGKIKFFSVGKQFGFIVPDDGGRDVHFNRGNWSGDAPPSNNERVIFAREQGPKGPQATWVKPLDSPTVSRQERPKEAAGQHANAASQAAAQATPETAFSGTVKEANGWKVKVDGQQVLLSITQPPEWFRNLSNDARSVRATGKAHAGDVVMIEPKDQLPFEARSQGEATFHHPYYFLRFPSNPWTQSKPLGHSANEGISGILRVTLTTKTPLLIPDAAQFTFEQNEHKQFGTRRDTQGNPLIPVTSVKGMLRSAYEAITESRLAVFSGHNQKLSFRRSATERYTFEQSPANLLISSPNLKPAETLDQCSPADGLFGFVSQAKDPDLRGAYRGHLRIAPVCPEPSQTQAITPLCSQAFPDGLPLAILGAPNPKQSPFYVADMNGKSKAEGYKKSQKLAGRKIYPHQDHKPEYWKQHAKWTDCGDASAGKEYIRAGDNLQDSQNRTLKDWIAPDARFSFDIFLDQVREEELKPLLWLLQLPSEHFLKLGGGKPYGFGSVRVELDAKNSKLFGHEELVKKYRALPEQNSITKINLANLNEASHQLHWTPTRSAESFLKSCKGLGPRLKTHYPRRAKHPVQNDQDKFAHIYGWFGKNEKGAKHALPPLHEGDLSLPYAPAHRQGGASPGNAHNPPGRPGKTRREKRAQKARNVNRAANHET